MFILTQSMMETLLYLNHVSQTCKSGEMRRISGWFPVTFPLLYYVFALSNNLIRTEHGYKIFDKGMNHLFSMDELKVYARNNRELEYLLKINEKPK